MSYSKKNNIKITPDYVIDKYLAAKKLKGKRGEEAMAHVNFLSQNLGKFIIIKQ
jgi:hypothetical protein